MDQVSRGAGRRAGQPQLRRGAVGLREVLFQSITAMAPGAAIAASSQQVPRTLVGRSPWPRFWHSVPGPI